MGTSVHSVSEKLFENTFFKVSKKIVDITLKNGIIRPKVKMTVFGMWKCAKKWVFLSENFCRLCK